jgi:DNA polymerase III delta subunit
MGVVSVLFGGDNHAIDKHLQQQLERLVPEPLRAWNYHRFDMSVPAQRFAAWDTARTAPWGADQVRMVVMDQADSLEGLKGSGKFKSEEELLTPSQKGNKLATLQANELVAQAVGSRNNSTHLFVVLRDGGAGSRGVLAPLVSAAREDGRLLEFSKSAWHDKAGRTSHVQRVAQGVGLLLDEDVAEILAAQLGPADDGHQIEQEVRKLQLFTATTGEVITPAVVGELCSYGEVSPMLWAKEVVARPRSRRRFLETTQRLAQQGTPLMDVLGTLLREGRQALLFKTLEGADADQGTIAAVVGWTNPRRYFPARREWARTDTAYLRCLMESTLQWRERVLRGAVADDVQALQLLAVELVGEFDPFELRQ